MNMKNEIKQGSFVRLETRFGNKLWVEVMEITRPLMTSELKPEQTYLARAWRSSKWGWDEFTLAPDTAHKDMVKEVLNLDPAVADIFRQTTMKEGQHE